MLYALIPNSILIDAVSRLAPSSTATVRYHFEFIINIPRRSDNGQMVAFSV